MRIDADGNVITRFNDPEEVFTCLEAAERRGDAEPPSTFLLIRASWLRAKQPDLLPAKSSELPPEAFISASELRKIYKQTKGKTRLLPIITVLHPNSSPHAKGAHPDPDGTILSTVCEALDDRWDQFTRKRGTGGDSGVADMGVFFDWIALDKPAKGPTLSSFALFYAHELTTVWMIPELKDACTKELSYTNGWSIAEHRLATLLKSTSDLSGYAGPWPQLLDLSEDIDSEHNEQIHRPSPSEPLAFRPRHEFGAATYAEGEDEQKGVSDMWRESLLEMLASSQKLTFSRLGWGDVDSSRLALLLPLGSQVQELHLAFNNIGDQGLIMLAQRLPRMKELKVLNLSGNKIGDPGASRLSGALTDGGDIARTLVNLDLGQNHIGDKGALTIAAAVSGAAATALKKLNMKGNPVSPAAKKSVAKALKKRAKG